MKRQLYPQVVRLCASGSFITYIAFQQRFPCTSLTLQWPIFLKTLEMRCNNCFVSLVDNKQPKLINMIGN